jgi:aminopeptidase N
VSVQRGSYRAPGFWVDRVELMFELDPLHTKVCSTLTLRPNASSEQRLPLVLFGEGLMLDGLALNGRELAAHQFTKATGCISIDADVLTQADPGAGLVLTISTSFNPSANLALEGLYVTGGAFCTQCEAEGFRRITYFPDRPDVLAEYIVTLRANESEYPVLLANGNLVSTQTLAGGRHEAVWHDPHKKPSYLFALVAGALQRLQDQFVTASGRTVLLEIYSTAANVPRCQWAMQCLKAAMRWDEDAYGREYDLDVFMIYAADDFNMGAMENKGLNIFNSRFLLADRNTATDADFQMIDAIVAHEYFHNWSGNRVTCRDWFQLSLKEGFTVFREQQYTATRNSAAVARIEEAAFMQSRQFAQDAGPMAHPIRPDEYESIDNFYTVTVYEKGAEVIRMLRTLLGADAYRKGADLYFARHDGCAATCDDFVAAMADASGHDLTQFKRWYSQAGTPTLTVTDRFDVATQRYSLTVEQLTPATPGQPLKWPMVIPLAVALLHIDGTLTHERVLIVTEPEHTFHFDDLAAKPVPSLLRGFSAPVLVNFDYADSELAMLAIHDSDGVVRWQALRNLFFRAVDAVRAGASVGNTLPRTVNALINDRTSDPALLAHLLNLPSCAELADRDGVIDPHAIADARDAVMQALSQPHQAAIVSRYQAERAACQADTNDADDSVAAHRALANALLALANVSPNADAQRLALQQWTTADNLTNVMGAMSALRDQPGAARDVAFSGFHDRWSADPLMLNRSLQLESSAQLRDPVARAARLLQHPKFDGKNPNQVRAIVQSFADQNWRGFHAADGSGYAFVSEQIVRFDAQNPSLAARFCDAFSRWHRCSSPQQQLQQRQLEVLARRETLSPNVRELVEKTLRAGQA